MNVSHLGEYFRVISEVCDLKVGDLLLCWSGEGSEIQGKKGDSGYSFQPEEFSAHFQFAPDGRAERVARLEEILAETRNGGKQVNSSDTGLFLSDFAVTDSASQALVVTQEKRNSIVESKQAALQAKLRVSVLQTEMRGILAEQEQMLELMSKQWTGHLEKLNYVIEGINLYLGRDEEFTCIQDG